MVELMSKIGLSVIGAISASFCIIYEYGWLDSE